MPPASVTVRVPHRGAGTHTLLFAVEVDDDRLDDDMLLDALMDEFIARVRPVLAQERARRASGCEDCDGRAMAGGRWCLRCFQRHAGAPRGVA